MTIFLGLLLAVLAFASFAIGPAALPVDQLLSAWWRADGSPEALIAWQIRLPRALLGAAVGMVLGLAGANLQGYMRNPLAEPSLIGASSSAALGAVLVIYFGVSAAWAPALPIAGMTGALVAIFVVQALAGQGANVLTLILAGVAINTLAGAMTALALNLAPNPHAVVEITFWLLGSLTDRSLDQVLIAAPFMAAGAALLLLNGRGLDALGLGERTAASLGVDLRWLRWRVIVGTGLAVGAAVSVAGSIGFIGLVVPHLLRPLLGHMPGRLLLPSAFAGGALLLTADIAVRWIPTNVELKLGVLTGLIGAPFFLVLLLKTRANLR
ncbi:iron complex transport system permease protein [Stella humosa]|uniref:Iron complex transport system permease protein n=1 Tax=Stella humosa TaxID=94 RepID=A0A3N1M6L9_9PROT|nr:iron ABC transporter permease [Stella humosa]ROQ01482.1 iron complex transport system permease protein [Stella humosa]BBK31860.1 ABC transporter permease [Stella humosa]